MIGSEYDVSRATELLTLIGAHMRGARAGRSGHVDLVNGTLVREKEPL
jgi:hypothetical protein